MPKMPLSSEHKAKNNYDFPKMFLDFGERARIVLLDPTPLTEYVHTMRAPQLANGQPVYELDTKTGKQEMKYDFIGRHLCLGSFDVIADKGLDVKQCPVCAKSKETDAVKAPERRHALNVIRYKTQTGSFAIQDPYQVELLVWAFADKVHSTLIEKADEWGDLRERDLNLGPCENKGWQKFDINVASKAEWLQKNPNESIDRIEFTKQVFQNNMVADLSIALGRKLSKEQVLEDLSRVLERHNAAFGVATTVGVTASEVDVSGILDDVKPGGVAALSEPTVSDAEDEGTPAGLVGSPVDTSDLKDLDSILNL